MGMIRRSISKAESYSNLRHSPRHTFIFWFWALTKGISRHTSDYLVGVYYCWLKVTALLKQSHPLPSCILLCSDLLEVTFIYVYREQRKYIKYHKMTKWRSAIVCWPLFKTKPLLFKRLIDHFFSLQCGDSTGFTTVNFLQVYQVKPPQWFPHRIRPGFCLASSTKNQF